ncbi:unnamed protein product [Psylliodes chrysocephalus]|uniref:Menorin-like domain-containing protein n=1 Tax=Psylliodes chrysocephalus TaxID=3402493 RepID=A0A9P0C9P8_9CUCU|nr:unnamed protein product [Psylliodes chrysocephala]
MILMREFLVFFSAICFISQVSSIADIAKFFPQISGNLTKVTWANSINTKTIDKILKDDNILMIKAEIELDKKNGLLINDLSLDEFLNKLKQSNTPEKVKVGQGKGANLDFKSIDALTEATKDKGLIANAAKENYPLWLGANILKGPGNLTEDPLDSTKFLTNAQSFPDIVLSLGWVTTNISGGYGYENDDIKAMKKAIGDNHIKNTLNFHVRASLAANSNPQFKSLLQETDTLTIFSGSDDTVDVKKLKATILDIGVDKVFLDVPNDLEEKLRLDLSKSGATDIVISLFNLALCILVVQI